MDHRLIASVLACALLVACGKDEARAGSSAQGDESLPAPGAVRGSVTGMPNPGTASAPPLPIQQPAIESADDLEELGSDEGGFERVEPYEENLPIPPRIEQGAPPDPMPPQPEPARVADPWTGQTAPIPSEPVEPLPPRQ